MMIPKLITKLRHFVVADDGSIGAKVVRSGLWVGAGNIVATVLGVIRSVILARLLTPEVFGLMGLAGIAIRAIETFTRPGIAQALIVRQQDFDEASATAFTLLVLRGCLLAVLIVLIAPFIGRFYENEQLASILQGLAFVFVLIGFTNIQTIARQKELDFRQLTYLSTAATSITTIVTVVAAFLLRDVWAMVIGQLANAALHTLLSYRFIQGRIRFAWNRAVATELLSYGKFITGSSIIVFVATEIDSAVIGKMLGPELLGYYALAATIANLTTANLSRMASGIMMPAYSKLQADTAALRKAFLTTLSLVMHLMLPAGIGLIILAEPVVALVYGKKWLPAVVPLQLLVVSGLFLALVTFNGYLFQGAGRPQFAFRLGSLRLAIVALLIVPLTMRYGLNGAALTVLIGIAAQWCVGLVYLSRHMKIEATLVLRSVSRPFLSAALMGLLVWYLRQAVQDPGMAELAGMVICGIAVYLVMNWRLIAALRSLRA